MNESIGDKFRALRNKISHLIEADEKENDESQFALIRLNKNKLSRYHDAFSNLFKQYDRDKKEKENVIKSIAGTVDEWNSSSGSFFEKCYELNFESSQSLKF